MPAWPPHAAQHCHHSLQTRRMAFNAQSYARSLFKRAGIQTCMLMSATLVVDSARQDSMRRSVCRETVRANTAGVDCLVNAHVADLLAALMLDGPCLSHSSGRYASAPWKLERRSPTCWLCPCPCLDWCPPAVLPVTASAHWCWQHCSACAENLPQSIQRVYVHALSGVPPTTDAARLRKRLSHPSTAIQVWQGADVSCALCLYPKRVFSAFCIIT